MVGLGQTALLGAQFAGAALVLLLALALLLRYLIPLLRLGLALGTWLPDGLGILERWRLPKGGSAPL